MRAVSCYLVLLMALALTESCICGLLLRKYHVHIINSLETNDTLTLNCKSKNDDLGRHRLKGNEEFSFSFRENLWKTTLFWCNFEWGEGHHGGGYRIYWDKWGGNYFTSQCGYNNCFWSARKDGLYLKDVHKNHYAKFYAWQT